MHRFCLATILAAVAVDPALAGPRYVGAVETEATTLAYISQDAPFSYAFLTDDGAAFIAASPVNGGTVAAGLFTGGSFLAATAAYTDSISFTAPAGSRARVSVLALGQLTKMGAGQAEVALLIRDDAAGREIYFGKSILDRAAPAGQRSVRFRPSFTMEANSSYRIELAARTYGSYLSFEGQPLAPASAYAYLDPVISFGAVPEPASWALMIAGFGVVGASLRRRNGNLGAMLRRRVSTTAATGEIA